MQRRTFLTLSAAAAAGVALPFKAHATVPKPYSWDATPPMNDTGAFVRWMQENRGEDPRYLRARFERFQNMVSVTPLECDSTDMPSLPQAAAKLSDLKPAKAARKRAAG